MTVWGPTATEAPNAAVADRITRAAPRVATHVPARDVSPSHEPSEEAAGARARTRVVIGSSPRARRNRARAGSAARECARA
jgi:hypothetical protein